MPKNPFEEMVTQEAPISVVRSSNPFEEMAKEEETKIHPVKAILQQGVRKFAAHAIASPRSAAEGISGLAHLLAQKGIEQKIERGEVPEEDKFTENVLKVLDLPKHVLQKFWPSPESAERGIKKFGEFVGGEQTPIEPKTPGQERAATIGEFAGSSLLGGPKKLAERFLLGTAGGIGAQIGKEVSGSLGGEFIGAVAFPAFLSLAYQIKQGKWTPNDKQLSALQKFGTYIGLTKEEITPMLQSEAKIATLGKVAAGTTKSAKALESAEAKLGQAMDKLRKDANAFPGLKSSESWKLLDSFEKINDRMRLSVFPSDEKLKVIQKIETAINRFAVDGVDAPTIIESWRDINQTVDWKRIRGGKKELNELKEPFRQALEEVDPELAKRFDDLNTLWGKMKNISSKITDKDMKKWVDYGESFALLGGIVHAVSTGNWKPVQTALGSVAARRLANKMLTDPKYQAILVRSVNAIKSSNRAEGLQLIKDFGLTTKEPEQEKDKK